MKRAERERLIAERVARDGRVAVPELAARFGVSEVTIRSDLKGLEAEGLLIRTHGGAVATGAGAQDAPGADLGSHAPEKAAIARAVRDLISPGDWVFLGSGTTCVAIARALVDCEVNVVTNNLVVAMSLSSGPRAQVIIPGGTLYNAPIPFLYGDGFETPVESMSFDLAFLGVMGIDPEFGYSFTNTVESGIFSKVERASKQLVVVTDSSKFGETSFRGGRGLSMAGAIVTAGEMRDEWRAWCADAGVELVEAPLG